MPGLFTLFLLALPLAGHAGSSFSGLRPRHPESRPAQRRNNGGRSFKLVDLYQGATFFDGWEFFSSPDPTHGNVNYLNAGDAFSKGLAFVQQDNTTVLAVDDTTFLPEGANRDSVRINTKKSYTGGLFIADFWAMPHGCSVWPAWWSVGPDWPNAGEIDIVEGVNNQAVNQMTLHTSEGCTLDRQSSPDPNFQVGVATTGQILTSQCAFLNGNNDGCAFVDTDTRSHGKGFNLIAGGVFAHLWERDQIRVWHFPRGEIPPDIEAKDPKPDTWPTPAAVFTSASCDIEARFRDHQLVLDTTICGDFAGPQFVKSGCPGTCAQAVANPKNFRFAKWKINYIAVYD
jgi:hypothetical protein